MEKRRPLVADIKRNSLDDGPGIRSVVFFKGCPLNCVWCHNPECISAGEEILYKSESCIGCKTCARVCPEKAIPLQAGPSAIDKEKCTLCGVCASECPSGALSIVGKYYSPQELCEELVRDKPFYDNSDGGVTLSGGEPTLFIDYVSELAGKLKQAGVRICVETCGEFDWDVFSERLLPNLSLIYVDIKLFDSEEHRKFTGRDNKKIKENILRITSLENVDKLVRIPLIPDITATERNLSAIAQWLKANGIRRIALLPYNPLWLAKARGLGKKLSYERDSWMTQEERDKVKQIFKDFVIERDI